MRIVIFCFLLFPVINLKAQEYLTVKPPSLEAAKTPLVMVDSLVTSMNSFIINPKHIHTINVFKDSTAISTFGNAGKNGVIMIQTSYNAATLFRLPALLKKYNIGDSLKDAGVLINDVLVDRPDLLLADEAEIIGIHAFVTSNDDSKLPKGKKMIRIITKNHGAHPSAL